MEQAVQHLGNWSIQLLDALEMRATSHNERIRTAFRLPILAHESVICSLRSDHESLFHLRGS